MNFGIERMNEVSFPCHDHKYLRSHCTGLFTGILAKNTWSWVRHRSCDTKAHSHSRTVQHLDYPPLPCSSYRKGRLPYHTPHELPRRTTHLRYAIYTTYEGKEGAFIKRWNKLGKNRRCDFQWWCAPNFIHKPFLKNLQRALYMRHGPSHYDRGIATSFVNAIQHPS